MNKKINLKFLLSLLIGLVTVFLSACEMGQVVSLQVDCPAEVFVGQKGIIEVVSSLNTDIIYFTSSDAQVLKIDSYGNFKALMAGNVEIIITNTTGKKISKFTEVVMPDDRSLKITIDEGPYYAGYTYNIDWDLAFSLTNPKYSIVYLESHLSLNREEKKITFNRAGTSTLTIYWDDDKEVFDVLTVEVDFPEDYQGYNLLFIGNSLTKYTYDIPEIITQMMKADGIEVITHVDSPSAQWIIDHKTAFDNFITKNKYTHVILQEQSNGPISDFQKFEDAVIEYAQKINENKAKIILYQTWGYRSDWFYGDTVQQKKMYDELRIAYRAVANIVGATVSPVGDAFYYCLINNPSIILYADVNHPSLFGAYLSACVHYTTLTGRNAVSNTFQVDGISEDIRKIMADIAYDSVMNNLYK